MWIASRVHRRSSIAPVEADFCRIYRSNTYNYSNIKGMEINTSTGNILSKFYNLLSLKIILLHIAACIRQRHAASTILEQEIRGVSICNIWWVKFLSKPLFLLVETVNSYSSYCIEQSCSIITSILVKTYSKAFKLIGNVIVPIKKLVLIFRQHRFNRYHKRYRERTDTTALQKRQRHTTVCSTLHRRSSFYFFVTLAYCAGCVVVMAYNEHADYRVIVLLPHYLPRKGRTISR